VVNVFALPEGLSPEKLRNFKPRLFRLALIPSFPQRDFEFRESQLLLSEERATPLGVCGRQIECSRSHGVHSLPSEPDRRCQTQSF
jgi:hypothetical protein